MKPQTDSKELIGRILGGERQLFRRIVSEHEKLVWHVVSRMIRSDDDRRDICQDVFMKVYQNLGSFQHESKLSSWIGRIAYNTCLHFVEKKREVLLDDLVEEGQDSADLMEDSAVRDDLVLREIQGQRLRDEVAGLPARYRLIVTLYHLDQLTYDEIAEVTGMPAGTVKSHLFRARQILRQRLLAKCSREDLYL